MKKYIASFIIACTTALSVQAQECSLPIGIAFQSGASALPVSYQRVVAGKLRQLLTTNGVSAMAGLHSFALVPEYEIIGKSITAGPPRQTVCQIQLNLKVLNADDGVVFSAYTTQLDGVGQSDAAAFSDAVKRLTPRHQGLSDFIAQSQKKIVAYYDAQADRIIARAKMLDQTRKYDEAIYELLIIPECAAAYDRVLSCVKEVWQHRINTEGERLLTKAVAVWSGRTNSDAAIEAANLLAEIDPESSSYEAAIKLLEEIKEKAELNTPWDIALKVMDDNIDMEQRRLDASKEVAKAYAENMPQAETKLLFLDK